MEEDFCIMNQKTAKMPDSCQSCGGRLVQINLYEYQCESCGRKYYLSANRHHKVTIRMSMGNMILICSAVAILVIGLAVAGYQYYTRHLVKSASRFSVAFRDFLMEAYQKPIAEINEEDLTNIKYLKIQKGKEGYLFTYSYEDYYEAKDFEQYEETLNCIIVDVHRDDFSPTNIQYFTGLTRLELYTEAWENSLLPEDNVLRGICCIDGLSKYGTSEFFDRVNPDTLEEVAILEADNLEDFSFMENLKGIKKFLLENVSLESGEMFEGFDNLEELFLCYVVMEEEDAPEIIEEMLSLPSMEYFYIEGKTGWYISEEKWSDWQSIYGNKITIIRK